jgi:hypothetical protein
MILWDPYCRRWYGSLTRRDPLNSVRRITHQWMTRRDRGTRDRGYYEHPCIYRLLVLLKMMLCCPMSCGVYASVLRLVVSSCSPYGCCDAYHSFYYFRYLCLCSTVPAYCVRMCCTFLSLIIPPPLGDLRSDDSIAVRCGAASMQFSIYPPVLTVQRVCFQWVKVRVFLLQQRQIHSYLCT